jgi:Glycosyl transferases group 1
MSRWFTCTPVAFGGGEDFFARDSGLMCRGLQAIGCESMAVMPGPQQEGDAADLIRTDYQNLESAAWWKEQRLDGMVLYAWGSPRYRKVAEAIHQAGIFLVLNQDNGGLISPLAGFGGWLAEQRIMAGSPADFLKRTTRGLAGVFLTDPPRAAHLKAGDLIACVSPAAVRHYQKLCARYGGKFLADRVTLLPHPVETEFRLEKSVAKKFRQVACVGRWQDLVQKRPRLLMEVIAPLVKNDSSVTVEIAGAVTPALAAWHAALDDDARGRVRLRGVLDRHQLAELLRASQVFYSPSAYESFGIAAGEALCCGCSLVAGSSPSLGSFEWFVSENSGKLAQENNARGQLQALHLELDAWSRGERDAHRISKIWCDRLHADRVAARTLELRNRAHAR